MRKTALTQEGYIGAETLKRIDVEGVLLSVNGSMLIIGLNGL